MSHHPKTLADLRVQRRPVLEDISIVIPTLGRAILQESLYWIASGTAWPAQVIVVDQGRSAQVAQWMEMLKVIGIDAAYVPSSERGAAAGRNRGLEYVKTRFVAVTDDDCFVYEDWLENIVACLRATPEAVVTGRVEAVDDKDVMVIVSSRTRAVYHRPSLKYDALSSGNMGTSMHVFEQVGPFDKHLLTSEDGEWAYRALRTGVPIIYAPEVAVRHYGWRDNSFRLVQYKAYARGHGGFYGKYLRKGDWFIALRVIVHHLRSLRRSLRGVITGDKELVLWGWAYLTGLLPGIISGMRRREDG